MRVLVTGGTGFIGSAVVRHLVADHYEVRVLAHHKKNRFLLEDLDVEIADGDITRPMNVEAATRGCAIVVDLASVYAFYPFWEKEAKGIYKINVQGTINVLNAALKHKVDKLIHTSTIATIGKRVDGKPSNEETEFDFKGASHYARSKYLAEQEVLKFCQKGLPAVILNLGIVIGERDYKPTPSGEVIAKFLNRSYPGYFEATWAVADVDDVAQAHIAAIRHGRIGERYILCNKRHYSLKEIFSLLEEASGVKAPRLKIPYFLFSFLVHLEELLAYRVFKKKPLMPTEGIKFCKMSIRYDNSKAVNELGYSQTPFKETLAKAVLWYRKNGYIEPRGFLRYKAHGSQKVKFIMQKLGMHKYTDRLSPGTLVFFLMISFLKFLEKALIAAKEDGWRKATQSYLRTEHSKFTLAVFRLNFWSGIKGEQEKSLNFAREYLVQRLREFLKGHPITHWRLQWSRFSTKELKVKFVDIVLADFHNDGRMGELDLYLDPDSDIADINALSTGLRSALIQSVIKAYNKTRDLDDKKRPRSLKKELKIYLRRQEEFSTKAIRAKAEHFINRILSAVFIYFEKLPVMDNTDYKRFSPPCFIKHKHPGFGLLNILCRFTNNLKEADLWIQFSHIPIDGVPAQEMLKDLKAKWGTCGELRFPPPDYEKKITPVLCSSHDAKNGIYQVNRFVDFRPFLKLRRKLNKQHAEQASGNTTVAALLIWKLAQYRALENMKFAVPVDLRASVYRQRTLGFVFIRPNIYFDKNSPDRGLFKFQREFNRQMRSTIRRRSESYKLLESYALIPPFMYAATLKVMPNILKEFVGTICITIIKRSDLFIAPFSDIHTNGFIAISNFFIPTEQGEKVCHVSIKGPVNRVEDYAKAIEEIAGGR